METQDPIRRSNPTEPVGTIGSIRREPQGKGLGATQPGEDTLRSLDGSNTDFNSGAPDPIRLLLDTEAEQLSLTLHQLQSEVKRLTTLHHHRLGGPGSYKDDKLPRARN